MAGCDALVGRYFEICNRVLQSHGGVFPFSPILAAVRNSAAGRIVMVRVRRDGGVRPYDVVLASGGIRVKPCSQSCRCQCSWEVDEGYMREVISDADYYAANPARMDWGWMHELCRGHFYPEGSRSLQGNSDEQFEQE